MGRLIDIVRAARADAAQIETTYRRPGDGTLWRNACRIVGDRVVWASIRDDGSVGRWRDHAADAVVTFAMNETMVTVTERHDDGSATVESFARW